MSKIFGKSWDFSGHAITCGWRVIVDINKHMPPGDVESVGKLIAAAPDLLSAAEKALNVIYNQDHTIKSQIDTVEMLRAAIKRAREGD